MFCASIEHVSFVFVVYEHICVEYVAPGMGSKVIVLSISFKRDMWHTPLAWREATACFFMLSISKLLCNLRPNEGSLRVTTHLSPLVHTNRKNINTNGDSVRDKILTLGIDNIVISNVNMLHVFIVL
jgi:hypothetical protein